MENEYNNLSMEDMHKLLNKESSNVFVCPKFPTKSWGQVTTKESTTDKIAINKALDKLRKNGIKCVKRIDHETTNRYKCYGKFYFIKIKS